MNRLELVADGEMLLGQLEGIINKFKPGDNGPSFVSSDDSMYLRNMMEEISTHLQRQTLSANAQDLGEQNLSRYRITPFQQLVVTRIQENAEQSHIGGVKLYRVQTVYLPQIEIFGKLIVTCASDYTLPQEKGILRKISKQIHDHSSLSTEDSIRLEQIFDRIDYLCIHEDNGSIYFSNNHRGIPETVHTKLKRIINFGLDRGFKQTSVTPEDILNFRELYFGIEEPGLDSYRIKLDKHLRAAGSEIRHTQAEYEPLIKRLENFLGAIDPHKHKVIGLYRADLKNST